MRVPWPDDILAHFAVVVGLISAVTPSPFVICDRRSTLSTPQSIEARFNSTSQCNVLTPRREFGLSIDTFAALGDSYASGLGAGQVLDRTCRRYHHSYPYLINTDPRLGNGDGRRFEPLTCAGATIRDVVERQIPQLTTKFDVITITVGGNDVGFGKIVDTCIFGIGTNSCERTMAAGRAYINDVLPLSLDRLLRHLGTKITPDTGRIYITGYAKFFNPNTPQCNFVSVSLLGRRPLDHYHRQKYNDLIDLVNAEIKDAAERIGPRVTYVNYDPYFGHCNGRLCEVGINEPNVNRPRLLFFERGSRDVSIPDQDSGVVSLVKRRFEKIASLFQLPDSDLRVFHPRSTGQRIIANAILAHMEQDRAKTMGFESTPLNHVYCPL